jgi:hypothetical protein
MIRKYKFLYNRFGTRGTRAPAEVPKKSKEPN